jgi:hypothetical protein
MGDDKNSLFQERSLSDFAFWGKQNLTVTPKAVYSFRLPLSPSCMLYEQEAGA